MARRERPRRFYTTNQTTIEGTPGATSAQATATTIVCPATTNVIWRVTAGYFVAP